MSTVTKVNKIVVGYRLAAKETLGCPLAELQPNFTAPRNYGEKAAAEYVEKQQAAWSARSSQLLYTGDLDHVVILDEVGEQLQRLEFQRGAVPTVQGKPQTASGAGWPLALQIRHFLLAAHPQAWSDNIFTSRPGGPETVFVGFEIKAFLKVLGIECALEGVPLPLSMWYSNSDHRDIQAAIVPSEWASEGVGLRTALKLFEDSGAFQGAFQDETGKPLYEIPKNYAPCQDARRDAFLALSLAKALGMTDRSWEVLRETKPKKTARKLVAK